MLIALALACRRSERVRFDYATGDGVESTATPSRTASSSLGQRFYLVANDLDRDDWRTYRVDRISRVRPTGARFVIDDPPDAAALVAEGVAVRAYEQQWTVRFHALAGRTCADEISALVGALPPGPRRSGVHARRDRRRRRLGGPLPRRLATWRSSRSTRPSCAPSCA